MRKRKDATTRRITLCLPAESAERLLVHALRRRVTASELVRRLIDQHLRDVWIAERSPATDPPQLRVQSQ